MDDLIKSIQELGEWKNVLPDLEFREPSRGQAALIYRFLLAILSTLNEESRNALQKEINEVFGPDGVSHKLMTDENGWIVDPYFCIDHVLNNVFQCLKEPSADTHHDLLPPAATEPSGPFDDYSTDKLVFLPNRIYLVCKFLDDLLDSCTQDQIYSIFGKPINVNAKLNVFTTRNIVSRLVEGLNHDL